MIDLAAGWRTAFAPPDRRPIREWGSDNVTLPPTLSRSGKYDPSVSPHFDGPLRAVQQDSVRQVAILKPIRGGGTLIADIAVPWAIANESAGVLWIFQDDQIAKEHAELRQWPILRHCAPIGAMMPDDRHKRRTQEIIFANGLPFILCGPAISNLQSRGFKWVVCDEPWLYKPGILAQAMGRLGDFVRMGNSKLLCISQGGDIEHDWDRHVSEHVMHEYAVPCAGCGRFFFLKWSAWRDDRTRWGICFDAPRFPDGSYDLKKGVETLRFACPHCDHAHRDTEATRLAWRRGGKWVCQKGGPESPEVTVFPERVAFHWNSILDYPWRALLEEWLSAQRAKHLGNHLPLVIFVQKRLAEMASEVTVQERETMFATFDPGEAWHQNPSEKVWPGEHIRFMTIDRQQEQTYWVTIRAWAKGTGESRRIYFGRAYGEQELEAIRVKYGVHPKCTLIDAGFESKGDGGVYSACIRYGWIAVKGDDRKSFIHATKAPDGSTLRVLRPWAPTTYGDPGIGTKEQGRKKCPLIIFSSPTLASRVVGLIERGLWIEPGAKDGALTDEMEKEYAVQMTAEFLKPKVDRFTQRRVLVWVCPSRNNHAFDCSKMQVLAAMHTKLIPMGIDYESTPDREPELDGAAKG